MDVRETTLKSLIQGRNSCLSTCPARVSPFLPAQLLPFASGRLCDLRLDRIRSMPARAYDVVFVGGGLATWLLLRELRGRATP